MSPQPLGRLTYFNNTALLVLARRLHNYDPIGQCLHYTVMFAPGGRPCRIGVRYSLTTKVDDPLDEHPTDLTEDWIVKHSLDAEAWHAFERIYGKDYDAADPFAWWAAYPERLVSFRALWALGQPI